MEDDYEQPGWICCCIARCGGLPLWLAGAVSLFVLALTGWGDHLYPKMALDPFQGGSLLGVIVGVYFSFRMVRPRAWVQLRIRPGDRELALHPGLENKTDRFLHGKMEVRVWVAGAGSEVEAGESLDPEEFEPANGLGKGGFYRGKRFFPIRGEEEPTGYLPLDDCLDFSDGNLVSRELRVRFDAEWIDPGSCERGETTKYWRLDLNGWERGTPIDPGCVESPIDPDRIGDLFDPLEDPYAADERGGG